MKKRPYACRRDNPPSKTEAVALALLLVDFELESPQVQPPPESWLNDLTAARLVLAGMLQELHPAK